MWTVSKTVHGRHHSNHLGESGYTQETFSLDVIYSATVQVRRTTNTVAVGPICGLHNHWKTSELTLIPKEREVKMSGHVKNPKVPHPWGEVGPSFIRVQ